MKATEHNGYHRSAFNTKMPLFAKIRLLHRWIRHPRWRGCRQNNPLHQSQALTLRIVGQV